MHRRHDLAALGLAAVVVCSAPIAIARARISTEYVSSVIHVHLPEIRACYEAGLRSHPDLRGRVVVGFTILADGSVSSAELTSSTLDDAAVESCVLDRVRAMHFPPSARGGRIRVNYPFAFEPATPAP